ncbi:MAG: hypothetical protein QM764_12005 [Chitinophagaceae bacterium]
MNSQFTHPVSLYAIVSELLSSYCRIHPERSPLLVNAVPRDSFTYQRKNWLVHLMGDLYNLLSTQSKDGEIRITAKVERGEIKLLVETPQKKRSSIFSTVMSLLA